MRILENDNGLNGLLEVLGGGRKDGDRLVVIGNKMVSIFFWVEVYEHSCKQGGNGL